jgi:hypothetical protein
VGLLKTAATAAVASSVHGRIQRRQQQRWAAQDQAAGAAPPPQAAPPQAAPLQTPPPQEPAGPAQAGTSERLAQLVQIGELKSAGILTEAEFEQEKTRILNS